MFTYNASIHRKYIPCVNSFNNILGLLKYVVRFVYTYKITHYAILTAILSLRLVYVS